MDDDLRAAHKRSIRHRDAVLASRAAQCFHCRSSFAPAEIVEWCDAGATAVCPRCGIDSVIGDEGGEALAPEFMARMREYWFDRIADE